MIGDQLWCGEGQLILPFCQGENAKVKRLKVFHKVMGFGDSLFGFIPEGWIKGLSDSSFGCGITPRQTDFSSNVCGRTGVEDRRVICPGLTNFNIPSNRIILARPVFEEGIIWSFCCLLYTSPSPRDRQKSRMPSSA